MTQPEQAYVLSEARDRLLAFVTGVSRVGDPATFATLKKDIKALLAARTEGEERKAQDGAEPDAGSFEIRLAHPDLPNRTVPLGNPKPGHEMFIPYASAFIGQAQAPEGLSVALETLRSIRDSYAPDVQRNAGREVSEEEEVFYGIFCKELSQIERAMLAAAPQPEAPTTQAGDVEAHRAVIRKLVAAMRKYEMDADAEFTKPSHHIAMMDEAEAILALRPVAPAGDVGALIERLQKLSALESGWYANVGAKTGEACCCAMREAAETLTRLSAVAPAETPAPQQALPTPTAEVGE